MGAPRGRAHPQKGKSAIAAGIRSLNGNRTFTGGPLRAGTLRLPFLRSSPGGCHEISLVNPRYARTRVVRRARARFRRPQGLERSTRRAALFLVEGMDNSRLKEKLQRCENGPFHRSTWSIAHRGAPLQFPEHTKESYEAGAR